MKEAAHHPPEFSPRTFDLLLAIEHTPSAAFYLERKADFKQHVEEPLRWIMRREVELLPQMMRDRLETQRNIFSRFMKNDFGQGGAWAHYWGAFYPRGSRRLADVQLAVWLDAHRLGVSFYIGDYAAPVRERFERNCARYRRELPGLLADLLADGGIQRAWNGQTAFDDGGRLVAQRPMSWAEWLEDPRAGDYWAFLALTPAETLQRGGESLARLAAETHAQLFPLALLAMEEQPLALLEAWLER